MCVRPILTISLNSSDFAESALCRCSRAGISAWCNCSPAEIDMAVGKVSFEDCPILTWSLGWTGSFPPRLPDNCSLARPAMTSLLFIFDCVPEPVCQTTRGNSSLSAPSMTSSAARIIACPNFSSNLPSSILVMAADFLMMPRARMRGTGIVSVPMRKFWIERCVCAPQ